MKHFLIKIFSYIWPISRYERSEYSGLMEIAWVNGKKILNSPNANYSFGLLHQALDYGLSHINLKNKSNALILGLGAGSAVYLLRKKYKFKGNIESVEIDKKILNIAKKDFQLDEDTQHQIHCMDAYDFVFNSNNTYDIIIVDVFIDDRVPAQFYDIAFHKKILTSLSDRGSALINIGMTDQHLYEQQQVESLYLNSKHINTTIKEKVQGYNTLIIAEKN